MKRRRDRAVPETCDAAFPLIEHIYAAAVDAGARDDLVRALSAAFGDSAVLLTVIVPGEAPRCHGAGLVDEFLETHLSFFVKGFPWSSHVAANFAQRFGDASEAFPGVDLRRTSFFQRWMKPQKLAPVWPIGVALAGGDGLPAAGLSIFRCAPGGPFTAEELALGDRLVPHLERAFAIGARLEEADHARAALSSIVDRLPIGVILLDRKRRPVVTNASADRIVALNDGFKLWPGGAWVADPGENAQLQRLVADALEAARGGDPEATGFMAVTRPSGRQPFTVMATPLPPDASRRQPSRAAVALFVAIPEVGPISATEGLERLYSLTHAEAELVRLLSRGMSLEEAARARGVSINTARSHLRHVFLKTGTRRQGELVRLVLSGVAPLGQLESTARAG